MKRKLPPLWRVLVAIGMVLVIAGYLLFRWFSGLAVCTAELYFGGLQSGDAAIVRSKGQVLMIDTGESDDETVVLNWLSELGIEEIDLLLLSHPDKDHIGNATSILNRYPVRKILMPDVKKGSKLEAELLAAIAEKEIPVEKPPAGRSELRFGSCQLELYAGRKGGYPQINDASLVAILSCEGRRVFFGGDVETKRIEELLLETLPPCDIVKLPHHGRDEALSPSLLQRLRPKICIVTANATGPGVARELEKQGCLVWYTPQGELGLLLQNGEIRRME